MRENTDSTIPAIRKTSADLPWDASLPDDVALRLRWLGQAGFLLETGGVRILIDPYLSDSLAEKYRGKQFPHLRLTPAPVAPEELGKIDLYLATHGHGDHLDPGTAGPIAALCPGCRFVVPAACAETAIERGIPPSRLTLADAFSPLEIAGIGIWPIPAAHEDLSIDGAGHHRFLGYILNVAGLLIYHSGDCAPYPGLKKNLEPFRVDIGLLPVNGRDETRRAANIPGNFTLDEAIDLAESSSFGCMIGHHFGMFEFNTIDAEAARAKIGNLGQPGISLAETAVVYEVPVRYYRGGRRVRRTKIQRGE